MEERGALFAVALVGYTACKPERIAVTEFFCLGRRGERPGIIGESLGGVFAELMLLPEKGAGVGHGKHNWVKKE